MRIKARIDRTGLKAARYVFINWGDRDTDVVDNHTGCVVYSRPTTRRALETAVAFCRQHNLTLQHVNVAPPVEARYLRRAS